MKAEKLEVGISVNGVMNVSNWLCNYIAPQLQSSTRNTFLKSKINQEHLSAGLIAAVASFTSKKVWVPAFLDQENNAVDSVVIDASGSGADIQTVSVKPTNLDITEEVWDAIEKKHNKGKNYGRHIHLAVFSLNQHYKININTLTKKLKKDHTFWSYWLITPLGDSNNCTFVLHHLFGGGIKRPYQYVVDFTPPRNVSINFLGSFLAGKPPIILSEWLRS